MKLINPLMIFTIVFLLVANHHIFTTTLTGLGKPKTAFEKVENPNLTKLIQDKTGVIIQDFYIINSESLFGGMTGIPTKPIMTISKEMYETFSSNELNYVVLHEVGHYSHWHTVKEALIQFSVIIVAFLLFRYFQITNLNKIAFSVAFMGGIVIGILVIQLMRQFEWQADTYALQKLDDPQSMIYATKKLQNAWGGPADGSITRKLFYRGIPYSERIDYAESYK